MVSVKCVLVPYTTLRYQCAYTTLTYWYRPTFTTFIIFYIIIVCCVLRHCIIEIAMYIHNIEISVYLQHYIAISLYFLNIEKYIGVLTLHWDNSVLTPYWDISVFTQHWDVHGLIAHSNSLWLNHELSAYWKYCCWMQSNLHDNTHVCKFNAYRFNNLDIIEVKINKI